MPNYIQVTTTTSSREHAEMLADALVARRLAACVQMVGPISSVYRWQGKIETAQEWLCIAKTRRELYDTVEAVIRELHTYEEPEIIATEITFASAGYLNWINDETTDAQT